MSDIESLCDWIDVYGAASRNVMQSLRTMVGDKEDGLNVVDWVTTNLDSQELQFFVVRSWKRDPNTFTEIHQKSWSEYDYYMKNEEELGAREFKDVRTNGLGKNVGFQEGMDALAKAHHDWSMRCVHYTPIAGKLVLQIDNEWAWYDVGSPHSNAEGEAMGHCGNVAGYNRGDHVLSLRRRMTEKICTPVATFILNANYIGQMKGRCNTKPSSEYHSQIVELLSNKAPEKRYHIKGLVGRGYLPEEDFNTSDLSPELKAKLDAANPGLLDMQYNPALFLMNHEKIPKKWKEGIDRDAVTFIESIKSKMDARGNLSSKNISALMLEALRSPHRKITRMDLLCEFFAPKFNKSHADILVNQQPKLAAKYLGKTMSNEQVIELKNEGHGADLALHAPDRARSVWARSPSTIRSLMVEALKENPVTACRIWKSEMNAEDLKMLIDREQYEPVLRYLYPALNDTDKKKIIDADATLFARFAKERDVVKFADDLLGVMSANDLQSSSQNNVTRWLNFRGLTHKLEKGMTQKGIYNMLRQDNPVMVALFPNKMNDRIYRRMAVVNPLGFVASAPPRKVAELAKTCIAAMRSKKYREKRDIDSDYGAGVGIIGELHSRNMQETVKNNLPELINLSVRAVFDYDMIKKEEVTDELVQKSATQDAVWTIKRWGDRISSETINAAYAGNGGNDKAEVIQSAYDKLSNENKIEARTVFTSNVINFYRGKQVKVPDMEFDWFLKNMSWDSVLTRGQIQFLLLNRDIDDAMFNLLKQYQGASLYIGEIIGKLKPEQLLKQLDDLTAAGDLWEVWQAYNRQGLPSNNDILSKFIKKALDTGSDLGINDGLLSRFISSNPTDPNVVAYAQWLMSRSPKHIGRFFPNFNEQERLDLINGLDSCDIEVFLHQCQYFDNLDKLTEAEISILTAKNARMTGRYLTGRMPAMDAARDSTSEFVSRMMSLNDVEFNDAFWFWIGNATEKDLKRMVESMDTDRLNRVGDDPARISALLSSSPGLIETLARFISPGIIEEMGVYDEQKMSGKPLPKEIIQHLDRDRVMQAVGTIGSKALIQFFNIFADPATGEAFLREIIQNYPNFLDKGSSLIERGGLDISQIDPATAAVILDAPVSFATIYKWWSKMKNVDADNERRMLNRVVNDCEDPATMRKYLEYATEKGMTPEELAPLTQKMTAMEAQGEQH